jgi:hypothetical protein
MYGFILKIIPIIYLKPKYNYPFALTCFIRYIYDWNLQFLNNEIIMIKVDIPQV